jgi:malate/lactate dehydrogenase
VLGAAGAGLMAHQLAHQRIDHSGRDAGVLQPGRKGVPEVMGSLVSVLGAGGVQQMHEPAMTGDERAARERSAGTLRETARRVLAVRP